MMTSLNQKVNSRLILFHRGLHGQSAVGRWTGSNPEVSCLYETW